MALKPGKLQLPAWWPEALRQVTGIDTGDSSQLHRLLPALRQLTAYLNATDARGSGAQRYMKDKRLRTAYLVYYSSANMLKLHRALRELAMADALPGGALRVLDLGAGPGTAAAGLAALLPELYPADAIPEIHITAIDAVSQNLATYELVATAVSARGGLSMHVTTQSADLTSPPPLKERYDLVLAMNVVNELPPAKRAQLLTWLGDRTDANGQLLLIEPALRETSRALLELRDEAVRAGWTVFSPCLRQKDCPALIKSTDWCHDDLPWERPDFMEELDEEIGNIKKSLKYSYVVLNRNGKTLREALDTSAPGRTSTTSEMLTRVVSERFDEKGRLWWHMCGKEGRSVCQRNRRDGTDRNADAERVQRYDVITLKDMERREHDILIPAEGSLRIIS
ncbi:small ribosomal subunit Rsm22 family protein [bacterium]|nr:small ribosomal subunit Rsm22 family protein [bacterium]